MKVNCYLETEQIVDNQQKEREKERQSNWVGGGGDVVCYHDGGN